MIKKVILPNKIRLVYVPLKQTEALTLLVLVKVGSRYETPLKRGLAHFIEHMHFKGTKKRPNTQAIASELDSYGAEYNAFTGKDLTGYYIKIDSTYLFKALEILSDLLLNSLYESREMEKEKKVILEEIKMYEDNPSLFIESLFEQLIYSNHPLGEIILGTPSTVRSFTKKDLKSFFQKYYTASRIVVVIAGKIPKKINSEIYHFLRFNQKQKNIKFSRFSFKQRRPQFKIKYKKTQQAHLALGFPSYSYFSSKKYALEILNIILGATMSSRLFLEIREKQGLAYFIHSGINFYEDIGNFHILAGVPWSKVNEAFINILKELKRIKDKGVDPKELRKAKNHLKGRLALELEDSVSWASYVGRQELFIKRILTPQQKIKEYEKVKESQLQNIAQEIFNPQKLNLALIAPIKKISNFYKIVSSSL